MISKHLGNDRDEKQSKWSLPLVTTVTISKTGPISELCHFGELHFREWIVEIPHWISVNALLDVRIPVAHELITVVRPIVHFIVFPTDHFQQFEKMQSTSRIDSRYGSMCLPVLKPRPTG